MLLQKLEIRSLKDQVIRLLEERGDNNEGASPSEDRKLTLNTMNIASSPQTVPNAGRMGSNSNLRVSAKLTQDK